MSETQHPTTPPRRRRTLHSAWQGVWPPAQTLDTDKLRDLCRAVTAVPHGRQRTIAVMGTARGAGATTLTALLACLAHAIHGVGPTLLAGLEPQPLNPTLGARLPEHQAAPHQPQPGMLLNAAARALRQEATSPLLLVDTPLSTTHLDPAFFALPDLVVLVNTPVPDTRRATAPLHTWLHRVRAGRGTDELIDVTIYQEASARPASVAASAIPHDPGLRYGAVHLDLLREPTRYAVLTVLAAINTPSARM